MNILEHLKEKELEENEKSILKNEVKKIKRFDEGGRIEIEDGKLKHLKSVHDTDYRDTDEFKKILEFFGEYPKLKLLWDVLYYYVKKRMVLLTEVLPKLMQELNQVSCVLDDDDHTKIEIETVNRTAILDEDKFFAWLKKKGYGPMLKTNISTSEEYAKIILDFLFKKGIDSEVKNELHYKTREKIINERIEKNEDLPGPDVLAITPVERAKLK